MTQTYPHPQPGWSPDPWHRQSETLLEIMHKLAFGGLLGPRYELSVTIFFEAGSFDTKGDVNACKSPDFAHCGSIEAQALAWARGWLWDLLGPHPPQWLTSVPLRIPIGEMSSA